MAKTLLPEDFLITQEIRDWAELKAPTVNIDVEFETFAITGAAMGRKWPTGMLS